MRKRWAWSLGGPCDGPWPLPGGAGGVFQSGCMEVWVTNPPPFSVVVFREGIFPRKTPGREAGGRHTGASQGVGCTAAGDRPRGGGPRGSSGGDLPSSWGHRELVSWRPGRRAGAPAGGRPRDSDAHFLILSPWQMVTRTKKIFVGGLSVNTTVEDVKQYFEQFGKVGEIGGLAGVGKAWDGSAVSGVQPGHSSCYKR